MLINQLAPIAIIESPFILYSISTSLYPICIYKVFTNEIIALILKRDFGIVVKTCILTGFTGLGFA